jgi:hypothetical protein
MSCRVAVSKLPPSPRLFKTIPAMQVFTLGGSWSGGIGGKDGEIFELATGKWRNLSAVPVSVILTDDPQGDYRADNYGWFFAWKDAEGVPRFSATSRCHTFCLVLRAVPSALVCGRSTSVSVC